LVLTAAHNVDYLSDIGNDQQLLVRTIEGSELAAQVALVCDEASQVDLALLEITDHGFDENLQQVTFVQVDRDSPAAVSRCWAVGFPRFGEAGPVLPEGSRREAWHVRGEILPGGKLRARLLSLQVTARPQSLPTSLAGSEWEGMSGAVVFATDPDGDEQAVGVVTTHHRPEGESALAIVPITAVGGQAMAAQWWQKLEVIDPSALPVLPRSPSSSADIPLAGEVRAALDRQRQYCQAVGRAFFTPDLLVALLDMPGRRVVFCFENAHPNGRGLIGELRRWVAGLRVEDAGPFVPFNWTKRPDIRRAQDIAAGFGAPAVTDALLLLGVLETESKTRADLAAQFGGDLSPLREQAVRLSWRTPGAVFGQS
jgi:hypothetical protein